MVTRMLLQMRKKNRYQKRFDRFAESMRDQYKDHVTIPSVDSKTEKISIPVKRKQNDDNQSLPKKKSKTEPPSTSTSVHAHVPSLNR